MAKNSVLSFSDGAVENPCICVDTEFLEEARLTLLGYLQSTDAGDVEEVSRADDHVVFSVRPVTGLFTELIARTMSEDEEVRRLGIQPTDIKVASDGDIRVTVHRPMFSLLP